MPLSPTRATFHVFAAKALWHPTPLPYASLRPALLSLASCQSELDGGPSTPSAILNIISEVSCHHSITKSARVERALSSSATLSANDGKNTALPTLDTDANRLPLLRNASNLSRVAPTTNYKRYLQDLSRNDMKFSPSRLLKKLRITIPSRFKVTHPNVDRPLPTLHGQPTPPTSTIGRRGTTTNAEESTSAPISPAIRDTMWRRPTQPEVAPDASTRLTRISSSVTSSLESETDFSFQQESLTVTESSLHTCQCCEIVRIYKLLQLLPGLETYLVDRSTSECAAKCSLQIDRASPPLSFHSNQGWLADDEISLNEDIGSPTPPPSPTSTCLADENEDFEERRVVSSNEYPDFQCPPSPSELPPPVFYSDELGPSTIPFPLLPPTPDPNPPALGRVVTAFSWPIEGPSPTQSSQPHTEDSHTPIDPIDHLSLDPSRVHDEDCTISQFPDVNFSDPLHADGPPPFATFPRRQGWLSAPWPVFIPPQPSWTIADRLKRGSLEVVIPPSPSSAYVHEVPSVWQLMREVQLAEQRKIDAGLVRTWGAEGQDLAAGADRPPYIIAQDPVFPPGLPFQARRQLPSIASPCDEIYYPNSRHLLQAPIGSSIETPLPVRRIMVECVQPKPCKLRDMEGLKRIRNWEFTPEEERFYGVNQLEEQKQAIPVLSFKPWWSPQKKQYWEVY